MSDSLSTTILSKTRKSSKNKTTIQEPDGKKDTQILMVNESPATLDVTSPTAVVPMPNPKASFSPSTAHTINLTQILNFCFPDATAICSGATSTARLFLIAECGPLVASHSYLSCLCSSCQSLIRQHSRTNVDVRAIHLGSRLYTHDDVETILSFLCDTCRQHTHTHYHITGGKHGSMIVNNKQVTTMCQQNDRFDLLEAYHRSHGLSRPEEDLFLSSLNREKHAIIAARYTQQQIRDMFANVKRIEAGEDKLLSDVSEDDQMMSFYDVRDIIQSHRTARIRHLRAMFPALTTSSFKSTTALSTLDATAMINASSTSMSGTKVTSQRHPLPLSRDHGSILTTHLLTHPINPHQVDTLNQRLLHKYSAKVSELQTASNVELLHNCYLMRHDLPSEKINVPWL